MSQKLISSFKEFVEILFWKYQKFKEGRLSNKHYYEFYTSYFDIEESFYMDKKILDISCGPRGSLEWATMASERIGLDPLVDKYLKLGADSHRMKYIKAYAENIPFEDNYFDVVCSFNSLDHVEDIQKATQEISRVTKKDGLLLLIVDIHNYSTPTEPQKLDWDFVKTYFSKYEVVTEKHLKSIKTGRIYTNARNNIPTDSENSKSGLLVAKLRLKV